MDPEKLKTWLNEQIEQQRVKNNGGPAYHVYSTCLSWLTQTTNINHIFNLLDANKRAIQRGLCRDGEWGDEALECYKRVTEYIEENNYYNLYRFGKSGSVQLIEEKIFGKQAALKRMSERGCYIHAREGSKQDYKYKNKIAKQESNK